MLEVKRNMLSEQLEDLKKNVYQNETALSLISDLTMTINALNSYLGNNLKTASCL